MLGLKEDLCLVQKTHHKCNNNLHNKMKFMIIIKNKVVIIVFNFYYINIYVNLLDTGRSSK